MRPEVVAVHGVCAVLPLTLLALSRWLPPRVPGDARPFEELKRDYGRWAHIAFAFALVTMPTTGVLWWWLLTSLAGDGGVAAEAEILLRPDPVVWGLPATLLGILTGGLLLELLSRAVLGERFGEYLEFEAELAGFDARALFRPTCAILAIGASLGIVLFGGWYVVFTETELRSSALLSLEEKVRSYEALESLELASTFVAPNGETVERRTIELAFSDGSLWSSRWSPAELSESQVLALARALSERSGVPVSAKRTPSSVVR